MRGCESDLGAARHVHYGDARSPVNQGVCVATSYVPRSGSGVVPISVPTTMLWLVGTTVLALLAYYFIGIDQGAVSILGSDMHIHEFVHDSRHFLGFPCH